MVSTEKILCFTSDYRMSVTPRLLELHFTVCISLKHTANSTDILMYVVMQELTLTIGVCKGKGEQRHIHCSSSFAAITDVPFRIWLSIWWACYFIYTKIPQYKSLEPLNVEGCSKNKIEMIFISLTGSYEVPCGTLHQSRVGTSETQFLLPAIMSVFGHRKSSTSLNDSSFFFCINEFSATPVHPWHFHVKLHFTKLSPSCYVIYYLYGSVLSKNLLTDKEDIWSDRDVVQTMC